ncbi:MAG: hypothetical protein NZM25_05555 [Leptospiraceae bacterium]|nr:hypothetical protein [Leptospiraceae bacterium]MDW8306512.1 hypothetical protein [Leptospiraceae bacterium]
MPALRKIWPITFALFCASYPAYISDNMLQNLSEEEALRLREKEQLVLDKKKEYDDAKSAYFLAKQELEQYKREVPSVKEEKKLLELEEKEAVYAQTLKLRQQEFMLVLAELEEYKAKLLATRMPFDTKPYEEQRREEQNRLEKLKKKQQEK